MMKTMAVAFCLLIGLSTPYLVDAQTQYISDMLVVTLRSNTGTNHQVLERLASNTPVTILREEGNFSLVRSPSGTEGFILKQYLTPNTPKAAVIEQLQADLSALRAEHDSLLNRLPEAPEADPRSADLTVQLEEARSSLKQMTEQYESLRAGSSDALTLLEDNQLLREQNELLNREVAVLREENSSFHRANMVQWFFAGAGVFFGGWLIGKISRQRPRGFSR